MTIKKFKLFFEKLPKNILHDHEGKKVLKLQFMTLFGSRRFTFEDGIVIQTYDPLIQAQLQNYTPPRLPIKTRPKGDLEAEMKAPYEHKDFKKVKPFKKVSKNTQHHVEL